MGYCKKISDTAVRIGELRFSYAYVFTPRNNEDGTPGKYSCQLLIPKTDKQALAFVKEAIENVKKNSAQKWGGKVPARLSTPLRDGDEEHPDDPVYEGMMFMNTSSKSKPGVRVLENGTMSEALDSDDFYSGCYGVAVVNFYPYSVSGNNGVAAGLNNVMKTRDGERLSGGRTAEEDFADLSSGSDDSFLD